MSDIVPYYMHESGSIPGIPGIFGGGQTVWVDPDTREVVDQMPILMSQEIDMLAHLEIKETFPVKKIEDASPVDEEVKE